MIPDLPLTFPPLLDATMLRAWKGCERQFFWEFLAQRGLPGKSIHLHAGAAFALGVEVTRRYIYGPQRMSKDEALIRGFVAFTKAYGDAEPNQDTNKTWDRVATALIAYFDQYNPLFDGVKPVIREDGEPMLEFRFAVPLPIRHPVTGDPILYGGRADMVAEHESYNKTWFLVDEKLHKQMGPQWSKQWDLRSQFIGYTWAGRMHGMPIAGTIVRGVAVLQKEIRLLEAIVYAPDWKIDEWYQITCETVEDMVKAWGNQRWRKNFDDSCSAYGGCIFRTLCETPNPENWLATYTRRVWNPIAVNPEEDEA